jgi:hypothetical protein
MAAKPVVAGADGSAESARRGMSSAGDRAARDPAADRLGRRDAPADEPESGHRPDRGRGDRARHERCPGHGRPPGRAQRPGPAHPDPAAARVARRRPGRARPGCRDAGGRFPRRWPLPSRRPRCAGPGCWRCTPGPGQSWPAVRQPGRKAGSLPCWIPGGTSILRWTLARRWFRRTRAGCWRARRPGPTSWCSAGTPRASMPPGSARSPTRC